MNETLNQALVIGQDWAGRLSMEAENELKANGMNLLDLLRDGYSIKQVITGIGSGTSDEDVLTRLRNEAGNAAVKELSQGPGVDYKIIDGAITLKDPTKRESPILTYKDIIYEPKHAITILRTPTHAH